MGTLPGFYVDAEITSGFAAPYPNPFANQTSIRYATNQEGRVTLKVSDLSGRERRLEAEHGPEA